MKLIEKVIGFGVGLLIIIQMFPTLAGSLLTAVHSASGNFKIGATLLGFGVVFILVKLIGEDTIS